MSDEVYVDLDAELLNAVERYAAAAGLELVEVVQAALQQFLTDHDS